MTALLLESELVHVLLVLFCFLTMRLTHLLQLLGQVEVKSKSLCTMSFLASSDTWCLHSTGFHP